MKPFSRNNLLSITYAFDFYVPIMSRDRKVFKRGNKFNHFQSADQYIRGEFLINWSLKHYVYHLSATSVMKNVLGISLEIVAY